jgi:hyperosmotically inducible protein
MRTIIFLGLGAFLGACASHHTEPAREPAMESAQSTGNMPEAPAATNPSTGTAMSSPVVPGSPSERTNPPQGTAAPRADNRTSSSAPSTWSTEPKEGSIRDPAIATPPAPAADQQPAASDADNTRRNARDRNGETLTPTDQSNTQSDIKITQQIRQALMADHSLSFTAQNVKIITINGKVTLRGTVKTDAEKQAILNDARNAAGAANVDDQLDVKTK